MTNHPGNGKTDELWDLSRLKQHLKGTNLFLIGMMGAGKSTVGRLLAERLDYRFFDTDTLVEQIAGTPITTIFAESGEATFRDLETKVLAELSGYGKLAIATGGGIVLRPQNWSYLYHGAVIWLDVPVEAIYTRLQGDTSRPLLQQPDPLQKLQTLMAERLPLYAQADLHIRINPQDTPELVAERVLQGLPTIFKAKAPSPSDTNSQIGRAHV